MKLIINDEINDVPRSYLEKMAVQLLEMGEQEYEKLDKKWRVLALPLSRGILVAIELYAKGKYGKEQSLIFKPERREDSNLFLAKVFAKMVLEGLDQYVEISIETDNTTHTTTAFTCSIPNFDKSGGQMDIAGHERLRENNSSQVS